MAEEEEAEKIKYDFMLERIRRGTEMERPRILEAGTGFGYSLKQLASRYPQAEWVGSDFAAALIEKATGYCGDFATLFVWDIRQDPPETIGRFDVVFTHGVLTCLSSEDASKALARFVKCHQQL